MRETKITACPRNCYSTCGMRVTVEDGRLRALEPLPSNRATPEGLCLKGLSYIERVTSKDRLLRPLARQPDGNFEAIEWNHALDIIAGQLLRVRREHGPQSVLYYAGSGTKGLMNSLGLELWGLFGGCTTTYGDLCWPAGLEATRLTLGDNLHNAPWDVANARLIILWGKNPAETNIHQMPFIEHAVDRGARLIVIDPRRTQSAESAERVLQLRPGTDGALALGVAHLLVLSSRVNQEFIDRHVHGFDEFAAMVNHFTPRRVAAITGLTEAEIRWLADAVGTTSPATICAGFGMQRFTNSGQTVRALIALLALTGNIGRPGAGWVYANLQSHIFSTPKDPLAFFPPRRNDGPHRISISTARLGADMLQQTDPPLKAAWIERGNPATQNPQTSSVLEALRALDFRVVVDQFLTDTAREADIVLPAKTLFEQTDVINAYWHEFIQIKDKLIEPPGEVLPESEIYRRLALRLGCDPKAVAETLPGPDDAAVEAYLERRLSRWPELSLEALRRGPVPAPGRREIAFDDHIFPTPSGKIELLSTECAERWQCDPLPRYTAPEEVAGKDASSRYPLFLLTPNSKNRIHSQFHNLPSIRRLDPTPVVEMNPADAGPRGISDGDRVRVFNDRGALEITVRIDHGIRPGCVAISNGWWVSQGGGVNLLSAARETDLGHGAAFHDNAVDVETIS